jgi:hypothetical protein
MIMEIDVIGIDSGGKPEHLGTFKAEVSDDFFGPESWPSDTRMILPTLEGYAGRGRIQFRTSTRPKNKPVQEDNE